MKCLPECGYSESPDNGPMLAMHMRQCDLDGPLKKVVNPVVVWRDGEFNVVAAAEEDERTFDIGFRRIEHSIELPVLDVDLVDGYNTAEDLEVEEEPADK